ncbi:urease accessory protein UreF [Corynebacterium suicordis]|uniref:Urease accessory protein UreF n=1 Tax=Corynebacterium suicordis DSM 45110 TaxID=1121369 RepID=A0ABR9ZIC7_9CORY|nr:urease accessory UreF family protein [Corynebacterium suicordis]MBF4552758.1 urease accessory protein UreF [Corynebacterium suicordis DSM 45110]MDR6278283.1 urease accessory protein [Corynebacterium suicordis]
MNQLSALLHAVTYGDSAYPSGRYTLSHGLEGLVQSGKVHGADEAGAALEGHLRHTAVPGDGVATAIAVLQADAVAENVRSLKNAQDFLVRVDHELTATKITEELRKSSTRVGRQTLQVHGEVTPVSGLLESFSNATTQRLTPGNQAIALGLIHQSRGLDALEAVGVELIGLVIGWSSAALRLRQCDHISGQVMINRAIPLITELAEWAVAEADELCESEEVQHLGRASPGLDMASAAHERAPARLFMS